MIKHLKEENAGEKIVHVIDKLYAENDLKDDELLWLIENIDERGREYLFNMSELTRKLHYGKKVYLRGLIEFTNYCKRECRYCGINKFNKNARRYRLTKEEILDACKHGYRLGFNTFVLQGGEDPFFTDEKMCDIVKSIKKLYPKCAVTLSIGERSYDSYKKLKDSGADRFLLRHETSNNSLYKWLHPLSDLSSRIECLSSLKKLGFQTGTGFMVGLPWYKSEDYVRDLRFIKNLEPEMVGIGPYITHNDTEMSYFDSGDLETTLLMLSLIRLLLPKVLLPATTALGTISPDGRERGIKLGANVIMPNLTPVIERKNYSLYNNKKISGGESAEALENIKKDLERYGYICDMSRGDSKMIE